MGKVLPECKKVVTLYINRKIGVVHIIKIFNMNTMFKTNELNEKNQMYWSTGRNEKPVFKMFAASKMSQAINPNTLVEFTDFMGRTYKVPCRNNTELKKAIAFFAELKRESAMINLVISQYPVKMGKIVKKYLPQVRKDLRELKLSKKAIDFVLG